MATKPATFNAITSQFELSRRDPCAPSLAQRGETLHQITENEWLIPGKTGPRKLQPRLARRRDLRRLCRRLQPQHPRSHTPWRNRIR